LSLGYGGRIQPATSCPAGLDQPLIHENAGVQKFQVVGEVGVLLGVRPVDGARKTRPSSTRVGG